MEVDLRVFLEPAVTLLVGVEIVENDMQLAIRKGSDDAFQESRPGSFTTGRSQNRA